MTKSRILILLFCFMTAGFAQAGQFRITPPQDQRKRQPPPGHKKSRLEIVNDDDRGYAIDVDYRRNRLEFQHRAKGDIFVPGNSKITLVFDDDDDWRLDGDNESLNISMRSGRTTTLRLETRSNRHQVGLFATIDEGGRRQVKQLFKYSDRPSQPKGPSGPPQPPAAKPAPTPPPAPAPKPQPHQPTPPAPPRQPQQRPGNSGPNQSGTLGSIVGGLLDSLTDNDKHGGPDKPNGPRR